MSKSKTLRPVRYFTDADGNCCACVPLANSQLSAIVYLADLDELARQGVSLNWSRNSNGKAMGYVKVALSGNDCRVVARIIAGATYKQQVHYRNGNSLDLRRDNLLVSAGGKAHKDCSSLPAIVGARDDAEGDA